MRSLGSSEASDPPSELPSGVPTWRESVFTSRISRKSRLQARARATFHIPDHGPSGSGIPFPPPNWIVARRGGSPANTRPGASSARAFVRDGLTSHPIARPDPTRGRGVPTAAPPRASSRRTKTRRATSAKYQYAGILYFPPFHKLMGNRVRVKSEGRF